MKQSGLSFAIVFCVFAAALAMSTGCGKKSGTENEPPKPPVVPIIPAEDSDNIVLAYVTSWSSVLPDPAYLTHINYAFGHVNAAFNGIRIDNEQRLRTIVALKKKKPSLKILRGWASGGVSEMAADATLRKSFAADCKRVITAFSLDGVDFDWEFPTVDWGGIKASPDDTRNFTLLMEDVRLAIGDDKLLTLASNTDPRFFDFREIDRFLDYVNIMAYDMGHPPTHQSALYRSELTGGVCGDESVNAHIAAGVPVEKLTLGIPFYGHGTSPIPADIAYRDILTLKGYTEQWDDVAKVPYMTDPDGKFMLTYDNPRSIAVKCEYLLDRGMLGAMYWEYGQDAATGPLRKAVYQGIMKQVSGR